MVPDYAQMKTDMGLVIADSAVLCAVTRNTGTLVDGRKTISYTSVATSEPFWIQPASITFQDREEQGVVQGTTHFGYQKYTGYAIQETDRVLPAGDTVPYEVVGVEIFSTHKRLMMKRVA